MHRIGNDIVDLKLAATESNWQRRGFLDKIFTSSEQAIIHTSTKPFETVWRLWSMKEAAYKVYVQEAAERFFNPKKLRCSVVSETNGVVEVNGAVFITETEATANYIYTICTHVPTGVYPSERRAGMTSRKKESNLIDKSTTLFSSVFEVDKNQQSSQTKAALLQSVSKFYGCPKEEFYVEKDTAGVPYVFHLGKKEQCSISISHHGNFGAFSILAQPNFRPSESFPTGKVARSDGRGFSSSTNETHGKNEHLNPFRSGKTEHLPKREGREKTCFIQNNKTHIQIPAFAGMTT